MGQFRLREHTADIAVEATGESAGDVFGAIADGLAAAMCESWPDPDSADGGERSKLRVTAETPEATLYDYLDELIYERDVRSVLPVDNEASITTDGQWVVDASYRGIPLSAVTAREVKAVTYSEMRLEHVDGGWEAYVVFDV